MATLLGDREDLDVSVTDAFERFVVGSDHERLISPEGTGENTVTASHDTTSLVWGADFLGLATALAATLEAPTLVAVADGHDLDLEGEGEPVRFPDPVGTRYASEIPGATTVRTLRASGVAEWSALRVTGERTLAMVDDGRFASAVILAAAALLPTGPVWEHATEFLSEVRRLGLRFAQAVAR